VSESGAPRHARFSRDGVEEGEPAAEILSVLGEGSPGRVARAFDLAAITNTVGAPFLRVFCEEPALSGVEGMGQPQWEWYAQGSLKVGNAP